jgi:flagellar hook-associated protein 2
MPLINFSGLASGIDAESLIKATSDASRQQRVTPLEDKVNELSETNSAFDDLKSKLTTLQSAADQFSTLEGGGIVKQAVSSDETKFSAVATNGALNGTYALTVGSLAKNGTISFGPSAGSYTSTSDTISAGTTQVIEIGTGSGMETVTVPISAGVTTINDFVNTFNNNSNKARASLINVGTTGSPNYRIVINANNTGTENGSINVTTHAAGFSAISDSPATNASVTVAGIGTITRSTNQITDIVPNLTLELKSLGSATLSISDDSDATVSNVEELITAWNDLVTFIAENNTITREEDGDSVENIFAALASTRVDDNALTTLRQNLSAARSESGSEIKIFADLGVKTQRDGTLLFDSDTFKSALANEPISVNAILSDLADEISLTNGTIAQYIRFNGLIDTTVNANKTQISNLNERISLAEAAILKQEEAMRARFARLESTVSRLQSQQSALASALSSLGG